MQDPWPPVVSTHTTASPALPKTALQYLFVMTGTSTYLIVGEMPLELSDGLIQPKIVIFSPSSAVSPEVGRQIGGNLVGKIDRTGKNDESQIVTKVISIPAGMYHHLI